MLSDALFSLPSSLSLSLSLSLCLSIWLDNPTGLKFSIRSRFPKTVVLPGLVYFSAAGCGRVEWNASLACVPGRLRRIPPIHQAHRAHQAHQAQLSLLTTVSRLGTARAQLILDIILDQLELPLPTQLHDDQKMMIQASQAIVIRWPYSYSLCPPVCGNEEIPVSLPRHFLFPELL